MAIEALIAQLERETDERVAAVLGAARSEAARRTVAAEVAREERRQARRSEIRQRLEQDHASRRAAAVAESRRRVLEARHQLLQRVHAEALRALERVRPDRQWLEATLDQALWYAGDRPAAIHCRPEDADAVRALVGSRARVAPDPQAAPGLRIVTDDQRLTVDATLPTRMEALRPRLARLTLDRLEGEP